MNWIWLKEEEKNSYAEFYTEFYFDGARAEKAFLRISADCRYAAYINEKFVANGQYADYPAHKSVDKIEISDFLKEGKNVLRVEAFHLGEDFSNYRTMSAGVAFEVVCGGKILAESGENTLCRKAKGYRAGDRITPQIGYGWKYDFSDAGEKWENARETHAAFSEEPRPIPKMNISAPLPCNCCAQGVFAYLAAEDEEEKTAAEKLQKAWLSTLGFSEMTGEDRLTHADFHAPLRFSADTASAGADGVFVIVDLGGETAGYPVFSVTVKNACKMTLGWGEHLSDLRIRTECDGRNFASEFILKSGENTFDGYLHRLGCRYLCIFAETDEIGINYLTLREATYPFKEIKKDFGDRLLNKIYETGKRTLRLCAHEHYEDCPWREQALYGMDSRNQMLFGYGAFEEYALPRASLRLLAYSIEEDNLVSLCPPSEMTITIPSFSLYWIIAVCENAAADYDGEFVAEMLPYAEKVLSVFQKRTGNKGVTCFTEPRYWNFYEWSEGLDGGEIFRKKAILPTSDAILTALAYWAAKELFALEEKAGNAETAKTLLAYAERVKDTFESFYDEEKGVYASFLAENGKKSGWHAYTQAIALSVGLVAKERRKAIGEVLKRPQGKVVDLTFAALQMKYDAIVAADGDVNFCIDEICDVFGKMLFSGATSYWETAHGEADFGNAGSLCHGWSAVVCYVFDKYLTAKSL